MLRKVLALLEGIHVGLNSGFAAYREAMADSEPVEAPSQPIAAVLDMDTMVKEMNDRVLTRILLSRTQMEQKKLDLN